MTCKNVHICLSLSIWNRCSECWLLVLLIIFSIWLCYLLLLILRWILVNLNLIHWRAWIYLVVKNVLNIVSCSLNMITTYRLTIHARVVLFSILFHSRRQWTTSTCPIKLIAFLRRTLVNLLLYLTVLCHYEHLLAYFWVPLTWFVFISIEAHLLPWIIS